MHPVPFIWLTHVVVSFRLFYSSGTIKALGSKKTARADTSLPRHRSLGNERHNPSSHSTPCLAWRNSRHIAPPSGPRWSRAGSGSPFIGLATSAAWISPTETSLPARTRKKKTWIRLRCPRALNASTWLSSASSRASGRRAIVFVFRSVWNYRTDVKRRFEPAAYAMTRRSLRAWIVASS